MNNKLCIGLSQNLSLFFFFIQGSKIGVSFVQRGFHDGLLLCSERVVLCISYTLSYAYADSLILGLIDFKPFSLILVKNSKSLEYSKACVKRPLKNRQNKGLNDKW